ncbi:hypothetical protein Tco_0556752 [Tanacetum coccineum]
MGRDTIQLDDAVSTISGEYLLEFTSEYGIPKDLRLELPGLEDTIVNFSEGKVEMDLFNLISAPNPTKVKTGTRPRAAHEVPLLNVTANRVIDMDITEASRSSGTPSTVEKSPLDFADEDLPPPNTKGVGTEEQIQDELSREIPHVGHATTAKVIPETGLEEEVATMGAPVNKRRKQMHRKELITRWRRMRRPRSYVPHHVDADLPGERLPRSPPNMLLPRRLTYSYPWGVQSQGNQPPFPPWSGHRGVSINRDFLSQYNMNLARQVAMGSQLRLRFEQEVRLLKKARAKIARRDQRIQVREEEIKKLDQEVKSLRTTKTEVHGLRNQTKNLETLLEAEADMKKAVEAKNAELTKELESLRVWFSDLQVNNNQLSQQVSNLQVHITGEEKIKVAFEEFKKYEDDRVEQRCAEMDARLDKLSVDFDEELYPHMLTAIAGRRWVIRHGMRLAVMKCGETPELRQAFANVVSARIVKGMSEGLKRGIEHGKADRDIAAVEAYDPEAYRKYFKALQELKDLKYPLVDQLEGLKDAPMELIMANPWAIKEDILLEDAITANVSRAKKKKCWVVCCTHGVGSAHHARSDGVPVSAPTVAPQGLAILLVDAATQTEVSEGEASLRLLRSKSLPPMYNLDWS